MSIEELFYDILREAETGFELDRLIGEIQAELSMAEENNLWED